MTPIFARRSAQVLTGVSRQLAMAVRQTREQEMEVALAMMDACARLPPNRVRLTATATVAERMVAGPPDAA
ncbi:hypothetical protein EBE87_27200 [Pseudoroseomonas wenyumeiae]|uniref:Uncharacterized protein n=1 Tax=Teichococcus wenyumeiae TaxID=2478470 RepID=A0A3A9JA80_9PROT|nr:hypothetical protein [Pseudoroseomonas wenyumeiae]RKK01613.1 hypothetical protein D6Z83_24075 [Pseudoroseomonas wenyumeiae]RMI15101.1 hypothetical protein EBE87_27200 [Pseudoroseomonas wenyumeiae]